MSPLRVLLRREGVDVVLVSVEAWSDEVVVRLRGLPSERTAALKADFQTALEAWHPERGGTLPPQQPAERIFDFDVSVADDLGTRYSLMVSGRGGSGTMFRADWTFAPGPPEAAASLVVTVGGAEGVETEIGLSPSD